MAIPKIQERDIIAALNYIDEHGVPPQHQSTKYELVINGDKFPPKYVIAVARHLVTGEEIATDDFDADEAKNFLQKQGFTIETKQEEPEVYVLTITAKEIVSTDKRFTLDNLSLGDHYEPLEAFFRKADGEEIKRIRSKGESKKVSNRTLPRIACQVFEKQLAALSVEDKKTFPVCQYRPFSEMICGIYASVDEYKKHRNTLEHLAYRYDNGKQFFVFYCWNIFSTIIFIRECLKRFGEPGDQMILKYREKTEQEKRKDMAEAAQKEQVQQSKGYRNSFSSMLIKSKNLIFHGAPGTGKSYLAREIAADIISNGHYDEYDQLSDEQKKQVEFVQFHPSYDYVDFVEGLRPKVNDDGTLGFELQDGIFKKFVARARKNYEDSMKSMELLEKEESVQELMSEFFSNIEFGVTSFKTITGNVFTITSVDEKHIQIFIPGNVTTKKLSLSVDEIRRMLESSVKFTKVKDVTTFFEKPFTIHSHCYDFAIYKAIKEQRRNPIKAKTKTTERKNYIFIIDEINRGEISKIFGELFFAIDPGYRGPAGAISTQYANLHSDPDEKFYIPENVYIIGTMNDIDRSVDSFDFAMRRRFRFVELKAGNRLDMLESLEDETREDAIDRMEALNAEIAAVEDLNENYQIGPAYFLKLKELDFNELWTDCLQPLLQEYVQGMHDEERIMERFANAYGYTKPAEGDANETVQD